MNDDSFARLVAEEVKNRATDSQVAYLKIPDNWDRWQRALRILSENLNSQIVRICETEKLELAKYDRLGETGLILRTESEAEFDARRKKIERFKHHVDSRLDEVSRMIGVGSVSMDTQSQMVLFLRKAIEQHQDLMNQYELDPTPIDDALWAALDGKWLFDDIDEDDVLSFS